MKIINDIQQIKDVIEHYKKSITELEELILTIRRECDHDFIDKFPRVNIGEYVEECTKCGE